ncbi:Uma2 family endonuclease [Gordonia effusa]|nr:Uma2 family endonuclease [Gordonia effusa]
MVAPLHLRLLTLDEWYALPEDSAGRAELSKGVAVVSPRPGMPHAEASMELGFQLRSQVPATMKVLPEFEVVLNADYRPTIRVPDLVVCRRNAGGRSLVARDVLLAVEIVSPSSRRVDHVTKREEYAAAGIQDYWIVDLDREVRLTALTLTKDGYDEVAATGEFFSDKPFPMRLDLHSLTT